MNVWPTLRSSVQKKLDAFHVSSADGTLYVGGAVTEAAGVTTSICPAVRKTAEETRVETTQHLLTHTPPVAYSTVQYYQTGNIPKRQGFFSLLCSFSQPKSCFFLTHSAACSLHTHLHTLFVCVFAVNTSFV